MKTMKKILSFILTAALCLTMFPMTAFAEETLLTQWGDTTITLAGGDTLDLSQLTESPESSTTIAVTGTDATIIGNPEVTFDKLQVRFELGTSFSDVYTDELVINLVDFKITGKVFVKQYTEPSLLSINYSGDCAMQSGSNMTKLPMTYNASADATLDLSYISNSNYYNDSVSFNGGTVTAKTITIAGLTGSKTFNSSPCITVKDCNMTLDVSDKKENGTADGRNGLYIAYSSNFLTSKSACSKKALYIISFEKRKSFI